MSHARGKLDVETLLTIVLGLVALILIVAVLEWVFHLVVGIAQSLIPILTVVVLILIILYLLDRI